MLPVPDSVIAALPAASASSAHPTTTATTTMTFSITPVFFNVGVNEDATIAYQLGQNGPQERNNADNFKILSDYCRRFQKAGLLDATKNSSCGKRERKLDFAVDFLWCTVYEAK